VERPQAHGKASRHRRQWRRESATDATLDIQRSALYVARVIASFAGKKTEALFRDEDVAAFRAFERSARRKLLLLHRAKSLGDLAALPGNRLEALKGDRAGQHSIRINDRWRICFVWDNGQAHRVEIVDYH